MVAQSQIGEVDSNCIIHDYFSIFVLYRCLYYVLFAGFIDFIVEPTFSVLTEMVERIVKPLMEEASRSGLDGFRRSR